jgi:hypothetical protein
VDAVLDEAGCRVGGGAVDLQQSDALSRDALGLEMPHQRLGDSLADALVVERDVEIGLGVGDRPVIGDNLDALALGRLHHAGSCRGVDGIEHDDLGALGDGRVKLLALLGRVGVSVQVDDLAGLAELFHLGGEAGIVVLLVARRGLVRHEEGDGRVGDVRLREGASGAKQGQGQRRHPAPYKFRHYVSPLMWVAASAGPLNFGRAFPVAGRLWRARVRRFGDVSCPPLLLPCSGGFGRSYVLDQQCPEARGRHALLRKELAIEVG